MIVRVLAVALVAQLAVVAVLYRPVPADSNDRQAVLQGLERSAITQIEVSAGSADAITLNRQAEGWTLDLGLPASRSKVASLLGALLESDPGYAVAQTDEAARRFAVSEDNFERRITLTGSDATTVAYLGTSPSFRKIHARRGGDADIFVIDLNSYDAPITVNDWLDRSLLAKRDVQSLSLYGTEFTLEDSAWRRPDSQNVDVDAMETLLQALASLQVTGLLSDDEDLADVGEALRLEVGVGTARTRLTILETPKSERYYLRSEDYPHTFSTSAYDAERLINAARTLGGSSGADAKIQENAEAQEKQTDADRDPSIDEPGQPLP